MEIPYIVEARKDTGLFNSKIAIWLFLASEVMLFGGLFSAYIFLRLGADFPWPERTLPIVPGLINTAILIASSVTVVFAWAELKLGNWRKFQVYMSITLICAAIFMVIKLSIEYPSKFAHQAIRTSDFAVLEGHVLAPYDGKHKESLGNKLRVGNTEIKLADGVKAQGFTLNANVTRFYDGYYDVILKQVKEKGFKTALYLGEKPNSFIQIGEETFNNETELSLETLHKFRAHFVEARTNNHTLNSGFLTEAWTQFRKERAEGLHPAFEGIRDGLCTEPVNEIQQALIEKNTSKYINSAANFENKARVKLPETVSFSIIGEGVFEFVPAKGNFGGGTSYRPAFQGREVLMSLADKEKYEELAVGKTPIKAREAAELAEIEFKSFKQSVVTILHRDKTEVIGSYKILEPIRDEQGKLKLDDKNEILTQQAGAIKSGIEIAIDQVNLEHFIMRWERDDHSGKLPISAYVGTIEELEDKSIKYKPGAKTYTISIFNEDKTKIDYYTEGHGDAHGEKGDTAQPSINNIWSTHMQWVHWRSKELEEKKLEITDIERYNATWAHIVGYNMVGYDLSTKAKYDEFKKKWPKWYSSMKGADHYNAEWVKAFPHAFINREDIRLESNLTPKWNNYYAIYFTITGLHGLHVIGGAIVLGYYLFFGRKMFESNPEWLANRVEVGGLFWHFVDLVWIFAFPIFYLM